MDVRVGGAADVAAVLALLDGAVAWLVDRGRSGQWGERPMSASPALVAEVEAYAVAGQLRVAEDGGRVVGALALGTRPGYAPAVAEPEVYLRCFVTDRTLAGRGVGALLLGHAEREARGRGAVLLRVDCWAGGGGALVDYYRRAGFEPVRRLGLSGWTGQLLERRLELAGAEADHRDRGERGRE